VIRVRRAEAADAARLVALAAAVASEDGDWLLTTEAWRTPAEERRYLRAVRRHPDAAVFVAVDDDGELVARLSLARDADLGLMVAETHRRRGIGRKLLDEAVAWARTTGVTKLELHVFPWNAPALALYEAYGFVREGVRRGHYLRDGAEVDAVLMAYRVVTEAPPPSAAP
jgi:RimJ/RimL family protein N-acetyltransferase